MPIRISPSKKGRSFRNTRRENRLEELGRVDAEKAYTRKGKRNLREEKSRIRSELATGGDVTNKRAMKFKKAQGDFDRARRAFKPKPPVQKRIDPKTKRPKAGPKMGGSRKKVKPPIVSDDKKVKSQKRMRNIAEFKKRKKEWDKVKIADSDFAKRSMKQDLWPEKFPGFDQSNRIRGGLKSGGKVMAGKKVGCQIK